MGDMLRLIGIVLLGLVLTGCGYDGHYRYPCQDPANWEKPECNPPLCEAYGYCAKDLLGFDPVTGEKIQTSEETNNDTIEESTASQEDVNVDDINDILDGISEGD